jgi:hypothetical protein
VVRTSPDGRIIAVRNHKASENERSTTLYDFWDLGQVPPRFLGTLDTVAFAFSPDSKKVYTGGDDSVNQKLAPIEIIELENWQHSLRLSDHEVTRPVMSPDGKTLAAPCTLRQAESPFWERWLGRNPVDQPGRGERDLRNGAYTSFALEVRPLGVRVCDTTDGREIACIPDGHNFAYAPDSRTLAVSTPRGIEIWDIPPRRPWYIDYGLPVLFALLVLLGVRMGWRAVRRPVATVTT